MYRVPTPKFMVWNIDANQPRIMCGDRKSADESCGREAANYPGSLFVVLPVGEPISSAYQDPPRPAQIQKLD